jgi:hypothetical protein
VSDALPQGEAVRRAVRWISEHLKQDPDQPLLPLIDQATRRFDLSPLQAEGLMAFYRKGPRAT